MLLIDGHNLIGQLSTPRLDDADDEEQLLIRLRSYRAGVGEAIVVYFDPGQTHYTPPRRLEPGITIRNAAIGQQADALIAQDIQRHPRPRELTVVTSDRAVQQVARSNGCRVVDSAAFAAQLARPAHRKARRSRRRTKSGAEPVLSSQEVQVWLEMFGQTVQPTRPGAKRAER
jgi:predicted RNA-binding protein with PIN domain